MMVFGWFNAVAVLAAVCLIGLLAQIAWEKWNDTE